MDKSQPLVSIVVVTYNAEDTVVETLESAKDQTYDNIEVIVSDDCSKDNTVKVIQTWVEKQQMAFQDKIKLLVSETNQGVCKNLNKAIRNSKGEYIKIIAGDDILLSTCCSDYINYVKENPFANFVTSGVKIYNDYFMEENCVNVGNSINKPPIFDESAEAQLKHMAYSIFVSAPTMFFSRSLYDKVGGFDERYMYEDHPFYVNVLEAGEKLYFLPRFTVGYRIHQSTYNSHQKLFNYKFSRSSKQFRKEHCYKYYGFRQKLAVNAYYNFLSLIEFFHLNKKTKMSQFLYHAITGTIWKVGKV